MAESEVQKCLDVLLEQKSEFEQCSFGHNKTSVSDAKANHSRSNSKLLEYRRHIDKLQTKHKLTDEELYTLYGTYQAVQTLSEKRADCFQVISGITTLEDQIQSLSTEFDNKAIHLVNTSANNKPKTANNLNNESMAKTTQNCITAVRQSWKWLDEVMQCAHVHLANAAAYHEFFHEVEEIDYWLNSTMSTLHLSFSRQKLNGDKADLTDINTEMKDTLLAYLRWQSKVDNLFNRARDIVPVHKRTSPISEPCPVLALTSYESKEISFQEGETLTLLNNSDRASWRVKNARDQVGAVPAVILLINGPTGAAVDAAVRLRIQLLGLWTTSVKKLGYQMIAFMQLVFKDWNEDEIKAIQGMSKQNRAELLRILKTIEETLEKNWQGYEGFEDLQEKISRLRTILEEADNLKQPPQGTTESGEVVIQIKLLEDLLNRYQEFWTYWETYKVVVELLRQPKYILVCDRWDQMKYTSTAHFVKYWDTNLNMGKETGKKYRAEAALTLHETPKSKLRDDGEVSELMTQHSVDRTDSTMEAALATMDNGNGVDGEEYWSSSADVTEIRRRQQLTTDEVVQSTEEVRHTFIIKTVYDPRTGDNISLTEAVYAGIIDQAAGRYVNIVSGESVSFQEAMGNGDITVEFKSQRKIREEKSSYGIITVKTSKETRPYTIKSVVDPKTEEEISTDAAYERGILNRTDMTYNTGKGDKIPVIDAIQCGLIKAEFHGKEEDTDDVETKTYAVNSVVDQRRHERMTFHDALARGILDAEEGVYLNNVTWERIPITDAIMKGFIKAKIITDTSKLNIDPTNKIVVERLTTAQEKILKAVQASKAFQSNIHPVNGK